MITTPRRDTSWMDQAACAGMPLAIFFPNQGETGAPGLNVCDRCPVRTACLDYDLTNTPSSIYGIYGGLTYRQRRAEYRRRQRQAARDRAAMQEAS